MTTSAHTKKHASEHKNHGAEAKITEMLQDAENKAMEINSKNMENFAQAANTCSKMAGELAAACSGNINCIAESSSKAFRVAQELSRELAESYNRSFSNLCELSTAAFSCRTKEDLSKLQHRMFRQTMDNYFDVANKMLSITFDSCSETLEPLNKRTTAVARQIKEALAA
ncbi:MAG TPA: phasin family protein [Rickettsiales bacterium]|nr:phasin family protein [Rickettsiales bacterium]